MKAQKPVTGVLPTINPTPPFADCNFILHHANNFRLFRSKIYIPVLLYTTNIIVYF